MSDRHRLQQHFGGWNRQRADLRDHEFQPSVPRQSVPPVFELPSVNDIPKIDQARQGACTGHGGDGVMMFTNHVIMGKPVVVFSRAMIYYDARIPEGTTGQDSGATVRDMVAGLAKYGACLEEQFPYNDQVFDVAPSAQNYADGKLEEAIEYQAVAYPHLNACIASGFPFVCGFTVYDSFESPAVAKTGVVPIPAPGEQVLGGHCTWFFGYNATTKPWTAPSGRVYPPRCKAGRNSWLDSDGTWWGDNGDFYLPQWFFDQDQASDYWMLRLLGAGA